MSTSLSQNGYGYICIYIYIYIYTHIYIYIYMSPLHLRRLSRRGLAIEGADLALHHFEIYIIIVV